jgi:DNA-binding winged helix-turn-helix (wHTH) protein/TolB-like protein
MAQRYAFGGFVLEPSQQRLLDRDGDSIALTPRLYGALVLFVERAGELIEKDSMMTALWPGLVVEENNLNQVVAGLRRALGDEAQGSRFIQTVPRRGFRFVAPVTSHPADSTAAASIDHRPASPPLNDASWFPLVQQTSQSFAVPQPLARGPQQGRVQLTVDGLDAGATAGWWAFDRQAATPRSSRGATLAVLPFHTLSNAPGDHTLALGMADNLIARLSTVPALVVRSTGSVARYARGPQDSVRIARELDVVWIVDGSLQRQGGQVRATARLLHASDGAAAWSGSFDQKFVDAFEVQDQIAVRLHEALASALKAGASAHFRVGTPALAAPRPRERTLS